MSSEDAGIDRIAETVMKLWTVWLDYGATGEGTSLLARIAYAENERAALEGFTKLFGDFYGRGAEAAPGVKRNSVTCTLFPAEMLRRIRQLEGRADVDLSARFHFNFA